MIYWVGTILNQYSAIWSNLGVRFLINSAVRFCIYSAVWIRPYGQVPEILTLSNNIGLLSIRPNRDGQKFWPNSQMNTHCRINIEILSVKRGNQFAILLTKSLPRLAIANKRFISCYKLAQHWRQFVTGHVRRRKPISMEKTQGKKTPFKLQHVTQNNAATKHWASQWFQSCTTSVKDRVSIENNQTPDTFYLSSN